MKWRINFETTLFSFSYQDFQNVTLCVGFHRNWLNTCTQILCNHDQWFNFFLPAPFLYNFCKIFLKKYILKFRKRQTFSVKRMLTRSLHHEEAKHRGVSNFGISCVCGLSHVQGSHTRRIQESLVTQSFPLPHQHIHIIGKYRCALIICFENKNIISSQSMLLFEKNLIVQFKVLLLNI